MIKKRKKIVVAVTGASGALYAKRVCETLSEKGCETDLILSETGKSIWETETGTSPETLKLPGVILHDDTNLFNQLASGSSRFSGMVIIPASMGTIGKVANGITGSLITRVAEVALKEKRKFIVVPRETPYSTIHLENLLRLDRAGALVLPASPGFYNQPQKIEELVDFIAARVLEHLGIHQEFFHEWTPSPPDR